MSHFKKLHLKIAEKDGKTYSIAELHEFIDFPVKRLYFIQGSIEPTGQHCHKEEKEFFIIAKGSAVAVIDQGNGKEDVVLQAPGDAIYVSNYVWHGFKSFSEDAIVLAVSSTNYRPDRSDYIEDYDAYLTIRDEHLR